VTAVPGEDNEKGWVTFGDPDRKRVAGKCDDQPGEPETKPQTDRRGERADQNGETARGTGEQDRFGQGPVQGHRKAGDDVRRVTHEMAFQLISAPPEKEKKVRKKEVAAKAMVSPKTIWIRRRKPPDK